MRKIVLLWLGVFICSSVTLGAFDVTISSGYHGMQRLEGEESLLMTGGGVVGIDAYDSSYVEIQNTAPYQVNVGGIHDLDLNQNSTMFFFGGEIKGIDIYGDAQAVLRGGQIGSIESYQRPLGGDYPPSYWDQHIQMYVSEHSYDEATKELTGLWWDDSAFEIQLHDQDGYYSAYSNIEFIVPEPITVLLFGFGALAVRRFGKRNQLK